MYYERHNVYLYVMVTFNYCTELLLESIQCQMGVRRNNMVNIK